MFSCQTQTRFTFKRWAVEPVVGQLGTQWFLCGCSTQATARRFQSTTPRRLAGRALGRSILRKNQTLEAKLEITM